MSDSILEKRGTSLEEQFFAKQDAELKRKFREERQHLVDKEALASITQIEDDELLESLLAIGMTAESLAALALYPMVAVAWSDHEIVDRERTAILKAAHESGISEGGEAYQVLESWLDEPPGDDVAEAWRGYIEALKPILPEAMMERLETAVMGRARDAAQAAGGFLGLMSISAAEEAKLEELGRAFLRL